MCQLYIDERFRDYIYPKERLEYLLNDGIHKVHCVYRFERNSNMVSNHLYIKGEEESRYILKTLYENKFLGKIREMISGLVNEGTIKALEIELVEEK